MSGDFFCLWLFKIWLGFGFSHSLFRSLARSIAFPYQAEHPKWKQQMRMSTMLVYGSICTIIIIILIYMKCIICVVKPSYHLMWCVWVRTRWLSHLNEVRTQFKMQKNRNICQILLKMSQRQRMSIPSNWLYLWIHFKVVPKIGGVSFVYALIICVCTHCLVFDRYAVCVYVYCNNFHLFYASLWCDWRFSKTIMNK